MSCPTCRKPTLPEFRPFCSKRCADLDLARWFRGDYAIPGSAAEEEERPASEPKDEGEG